jgi:hypothetical protein
MGIFTRLFKGGQENDEVAGEVASEESGTAPQEAAVQPAAAPPAPEPARPPAAAPEPERPPAAAPSAPIKVRKDPEERSKRLLSPTPQLVGGLRVAPPPRAARAIEPSTEPSPAKLPAPRPSTAVASPPPTPEPPRATSAPARKPSSPPAATATPAPRPNGKQRASRPEPTVKVAVPPPAATSGAAPTGTRTRKSKISEAFDALLEGDGGGEGVSTAGDRAQIQQVFDEIAAVHVDQVRNVMLELQIEDVVCSWIESSKPALTSLRAMAGQMDLEDLCAALDGFCEAIDEAIASGQSRVSGERKAELLRRYQRLIDLIPSAFALEGERDRREPIIVESLLRQVPGVEKITIDKLFAVGLDRLAPLMSANAGDVAATSGIPLEVAARVTERFRAYRSAAPTAVAAHDTVAERRQLERLIAELKACHHDYERASAGWSAADRESKREARRRREEAFLQVRVALARLGETGRLESIEKRPFGQRIAEVERYINELRSRPADPKPSPPRAPVGTPRALGN